MQKTNPQFQSLDPGGERYMATARVRCQIDQRRENRILSPWSQQKETILLAWLTLISILFLWLHGLRTSRTASCGSSSVGLYVCLYVCMCVCVCLLELTDIFRPVRGNEFLHTSSDADSRPRRPAPSRSRDSSSLVRSARSPSTHPHGVAGGVNRKYEEPVQFPVTFRTSSSYLVTKLKLYATFGIYFQVGHLYKFTVDIIYAGSRALNNKNSVSSACHWWILMSQLSHDPKIR